MSGPLKTADAQMIQQILPHRYPFLLIDRVIDVDGVKSATGIKNVSFNEPHFQGHFPGTPIMPGVTIVEAMAQTAGVMIGLARELTDQQVLIYFMSVDKAKFRRKVVPGDQLKLHIEGLRTSGKVLKFRGIGEVDGERAAEAEFAAMVDIQAKA